jgi:hypothetical protein
MSRVLKGVALAAVLAAASSAHAETIVSQRINATRRLIPLHKVTVGPDDQYQGVADPSLHTLVFTHKSDLAPHLRRQELVTGEVSDLMPLTADSQEPAFSPDGKVAFTYFKFNARGDICYAEFPKDAGQAIVDAGITCLKADESESQAERSSPFWRANGELGFLTRDLTTQATRVIAENIETGARTVLAEGKVWSPSMNPGGRYLMYSELTSDKDRSSRGLALKDLTSGQVRHLRFALPGISGFPAFSGDEKEVFFSHYVDDTNHDGVIDGSDNSVVFHAPLEALLRLAPHAEYFPEQLTSVGANCSYPRPSGDHVYVSCAFEGAIDVYQIPETGLVPVGWDKSVLVNAHQTSRSYADRILLLNTIKYRFPADSVSLTSDERLLGDHLLADDVTAARFYLDRLAQASAGNAGKRDFYSLLGLYVDARARKKAQPASESNREVSREFRRQIGAIDLKVQAIHGQPRLQRLVRGMLQSFLEQPREALAFLEQARFDSRAHALERYLSFELAAWVLPRTRSEDAVPTALTQAYRTMMAAPELLEEAQLYYGFSWLKYLEKAVDQGERDSKTRERRIAAITSVLEARPALPKQVDTLLRSEVAALRIIQAPDDAAKTQAYSALDKLMSETRDDYFLRKALYVRAILCFSAAGEFRFMDFVATNWLRYTGSGDTEFIHAREFYAEAQLDHGYESWGRKDLLKAKGYFYGSLSLTDDLESHAGFIRIAAARGAVAGTMTPAARAELDERYTHLKNRKFIDDNMRYVEALLGLIDSEPQAARDPSMTKHLDRAISLLQAMEQDRDSPVRHLMMGYCLLEKLKRTAKGLEIDQDLFQSAHRELMLAYDLGRDNARVKAAVLSNLGVLHIRAQNYGLAARFLGLRKPLGFVSSAEAGAHAWLLARALYYTHEPDKAADELAQAPGDVPQGYVAPLLEREAFYRMAAAQYERAAGLYAKLFERGAIQGDVSLAKARLSQGFALFKLKREPEAQAALRTALVHAEKLSLVPKDRDRLIDSDPLRIQLAAHGLLSRMGPDARRLESLEKRAALLPQAKAYFDEAYLPLLIQNRLTLAAVSDRIQPGKAPSWMKEALQLAEELGDANQYLSNAVYRTGISYLAHALLHPQLYAREDTQRIAKIVERCTQAYEMQKGPTPLLDYQKLKLAMLWTAYNSRVLGKGQVSAVSSVLTAEDARKLKDALPAQLTELEALAQSLAHPKS